MTESSFPIVGQDLTNAAWGQTVGSTSNGVLDDWGNPYAIVVNTNDTVTIKKSTSGAARAVVNGFGHQMDADVTLTVPAVTSTTTYNVGLLYDPANTTLPVKLTVLKSTAFPLTAGQEFLPLHIFVRQSGQTLAAAALYSPRPRVQPRLLGGPANDVLQMDPTLFLYGTEIEATSNQRTYRASGSLANPTWTLVSGADWADFTPSFTGFSGGTTVYAKKRVTAGETQVRFEYVLGKGSPVTNPSLILPNPVASWVGGASPIGTVQLYNATGNRYDGVAGLSNGAARALQFAGGPPSWEVGVTATSPFTWDQNDRIRFILSYPTD